MSDQVSRGVFTLSVVAGICWIVRLLRSQIWYIVELFGGLERLSVGLFIVIAIEYLGEILVTILAFRLIWLVLRSDRSFHQLERGIQTTVLAGLVFLIVTPFISSMFYFVVPQPDTRPVTAALYVSRNIAVGLLIGGTILINRW
ncbi:hypothetical protein B9H04_13670 [Halorubrum ezzemoulense DSM 17463]|uniref:Uncharacterized protein n=1 Tax=Halorubrum ezzemoulense DSM 17463 TaxID=1121945 RepID=A0A1X4GIN7_HALEZ|nr:hypothetical protein [Halorubrum ezzemoulense]OSO97052.1 hypothetical protein B9H04_13670 [Halorubrum ezzemoulense DSM 17463]